MLHPFLEPLSGLHVRDEVEVVVQIRMDTTQAIEQCTLPNDENHGRRSLTVDFLAQCSFNDLPTCDSSSFAILSDNGRSSSNMTSSLNSPLVVNLFTILILD